MGPKRWSVISLLIVVGLDQQPMSAIERQRLRRNPCSRLDWRIVGIAPRISRCACSEARKITQESFRSGRRKNSIGSVSGFRVPMHAVWAVVGGRNATQQDQVCHCYSIGFPGRSRTYHFCRAQEVNQFLSNPSMQNAGYVPFRPLVTEWSLARCG